MAYKCEFAEGDLVFHRSNPLIKMVVNFIDEDELEDDYSNVIECTWIGTTGEYYCETFCPCELQKVITI